MKLILYIRNRISAEREVTPPDFSGMSFENKCDLSKQYIEMEVSLMKINYSRAIENHPWGIELSIESKPEEEKEEPHFVTVLKEYNAR